MTCVIKVDGGSLFKWKECIGPGNRAFTLLREVALCSCLTLLPGLAWVLLSYVLHTLFLSPVPTYDGVQGISQHEICIKNET